MQKFGKTFLIHTFVVATLMLFASSTAWTQQKSIPNPLRNIGDSIRNIGRTVDANPNKEYHLTEADGPYLILATALTGPTARQDANALVFELRSRYKWNAYVFEKNFTRDMSRDFEQARNPRAKTSLQYNNRGGTQYVVLIGNFPSLEDNQLKRMVEEVRRTQPESLKGRTSVAAFSFPMAFGIANPMLPLEHQQGAVEPFIEAINRDNPYSLLRNPSRYTIQIATFAGRSAVAPKDIRTFNEREMSALASAGHAASRLCQVLRDRGVEAYEFHDRTASIVTVGGFERPGRMMADGTMVPDPTIQRYIQQYQGQVFDGIQCLPQPRLIEVPRTARR